MSCLNLACAFLMLGAACCLAASVQKRGVVYQPAGVLLGTRPREHEKPQDLSKVPGVAGVDYPIYHRAPPTSFYCGAVPALPGIYADVETGCQAYHVCHDGREGEQGATFLCTNGTLFNQLEFTCDWWYNVNCPEAPTLYSLNLDPLKNPYSPKPKLVETPIAVVAHK
ncbi:U-scoloptoxin(01)-Cw1a [Bacillus rossius redtenbacheri]|uniref:U-scoloptoxin(01)-Cw1a n=1 Tax=Bacillus rossius redtenbacheri TaxID=93214 RepID=UPI002FDD97CD